jgi:3-hydroxybutyryl-CoA dehydrogenase
MAEIKTVALIGAGSAGRKIAHRAALAGYRTILVDILPANLRQAETALRGQVEAARDLGRLSAEDAKAALERLEFASTVAEAAREADLVIEAVPDELDSKLEIFTLLDKICRPQTILASTTSTLRVADFASITFRPAKILGMRFHFSADPGDGRVAIVPIAETGQDTLAAAVETGKHMGFQVTVVADTAAGE